MTCSPEQTSSDLGDRQRSPADHEADDLDAYIAELVARAPPLSSEQRDKLALLLNRHHRTQ